MKSVLTLTASALLALSCAVLGSTSAQAWANDSRRDASAPASWSVNALAMNASAAEQTNPGGSTHERVDALGSLVQLMAAASVYNDSGQRVRDLKNAGKTDTAEFHTWHALFSTDLNEDVIEQYRAMDARVQALQPVEIVPVLARLRSEQAHADFTDPAYAAKAKRKAVVNDIRALKRDLKKAFRAFSPTIRETLLVSAATLNAVGDTAAQGMTDDGRATDLQQLFKAHALVLSLPDIFPTWISTCEPQKKLRRAIRDVTDRVIDQLQASRVGDELGITAVDIRASAGKLQALAMSTAVQDKQICQ